MESTEVIIKRRFDKIAEKIGKIIYYEMLITKYEIAKSKGEIKKLENIDELFE